MILGEFVGPWSFKMKKIVSGLDTSFSPPLFWLDSTFKPILLRKLTY
jgi:hypothetical protein